MFYVSLVFSQSWENMIMITADFDLDVILTERCILKKNHLLRHRCIFG